ncbi:hypothetical protein B0H13DRAFT_2432004 [Mycena leptocephala]|nr:hypothetical protein B0H13DRAFT_2432004 [Mycena leptocephala]
MLSQPPHNPSASSSPKTMGTTFQPLKAVSESKSDWLAISLLTARTITAAADAVPFPCVKGVFGTVVVLLETVEKLKKNRDNLKELCEDIMKIINVVQSLSGQPNTPGSEFNNQCDEFEGALQGIVTDIKKMKNKPKGLHAHFKEIVKLSSTTDAILGHRNRMQELRLNFLVFAFTLRQPQFLIILSGYEHD